MVHWQYVDKARGPLNEGGLYGERQGWHLPGFDDSHWTTSKPTNGIAQAGVQFYRFVPRSLFGLLPHVLITGSGLRLLSTSRLLWTTRSPLQ
jgi:hypothetical protein